jgi:hypothetical protein
MRMIANIRCTRRYLLLMPYARLAPASVWLHALVGRSSGEHTLHCISGTSIDTQRLSHSRTPHRSLYLQASRPSSLRQPQCVLHVVAVFAGTRPFHDQRYPLTYRLSPTRTTQIITGLLNMPSFMKVASCGSSAAPIRSRSLCVQFVIVEPPYGRNSVLIARRSSIAR